MTDPLPRISTAITALSTNGSVFGLDPGWEYPSMMTPPDVSLIVGN